MIEPTPDDQSPSDPDGDVPLIAEKMRVVQDHGRTLLQIARVEWSQPHEPSGRWITSRTWRSHQAPLDSPLRRPEHCRHRTSSASVGSATSAKNAGHMYDIDLSQPCASAEIGEAY